MNSKSLHSQIGKIVDLDGLLLLATCLGKQQATAKSATSRNSYAGIMSRLVCGEDGSYKVFG